MPADLFTALLEAVGESPTDDAPRLVLADWLMDCDNPVLRDRGECIAIECALAQPEFPQAQRRAGLARRRELWDLHRAAWLGCLASEKVQSVRGMVSWATCADALVGPIANELATAPEAVWLTGLELCDVTPTTIQSLVACPWWTRICDLSLVSRVRFSWDAQEYGIGSAAAMALAAAARSRQWVSLRLGYNGLSAANLLALLAGGAMDGVEWLELSGNTIGDDGVRLLASSRIGQLRRLYLDRCAISDTGLVQLLAAPCAARLEELSLEDNPIGRAGVEALAAVAPARLRRLNLNNTGVGPIGARILARSRLAASLHDLHLNATHLGDRGVCALAAAPWQQLRVLSLNRNNIFQEGALALADARPLRRLATLGLKDNLPGPVAGAALRMLFDDRVSL